MKRTFILALTTCLALLYTQAISAVSVFVNLENSSSFKFTVKQKSTPPTLASDQEGSTTAKWYDNNEPSDLIPGGSEYFGMLTPAGSTVHIRPWVKYNVQAGDKSDECTLRIDSRKETLSLRCKHNTVQLTNQKRISRNNWTVFSATIS